MKTCLKTAKTLHYFLMGLRFVCSHSLNTSLFTLCLISSAHCDLKRNNRQYINHCSECWIWCYVFRWTMTLNHKVCFIFILIFNFTFGVSFATSHALDEALKCQWVGLFAFDRNSWCDILNWHNSSILYTSIETPYTRLCA